MVKNKQNISSNSTVSTTSDKKKIFLQALENNYGNISSSCRSSNIGRQTYYEWKKVDPEFVESCESINEGLVDNAESKLKELIDRGNVVAIIFYLKCKGKKRGYAEKQTFELVKPIDEVNYNEL